MVLEDVLDALRKVQSKVHGKTPTLALLYRLCIEEGLLTRSQIAPNTFRRVVHQYELLNYAFCPGLGSGFCGSGKRAVGWQRACTS